MMMLVDRHIPLIKPRISWALFFLLTCCSSLFLQAQQVQAAPSMDFFEDRAMADADYEQNHIWSNEEDEIDFWIDQKRFENQLRVQSPEAYNAYLGQKRIAYLAHQDECSDRCSHGNHFFLQAAYYVQYPGGINAEPSNSVVLAVPVTPKGLNQE